MIFIKYILIFFVFLAFTYIGNTDAEGQVSQIELTEKLIEDQIENAKIEKQKNTKLYKTLGVTVGLTAVILLL